MLFIPTRIPECSARPRFQPFQPVMYLAPSALIGSLVDPSITIDIIISGLLKLFDQRY